MSGYAADILPEEGADATLHFIKKPFSLQVLLQGIEHSLNEGEASEEE